MAFAARPARNAPSAPARGRRWGWRSALTIGVSAALLGSAAGASSPARSASAPAPGPSQAAQPPTGPVLAEATAGELSASTPDQLALVEILRRKGVLFYGAWWCGHCAHQKSLFGAEAASKLPYVECDKDDPGRLRCQSAKIRAFPTWDYKGERREGVQELEELRIWVGVPRGTTNHSANHAAKSSQT